MPVIKCVSCLRLVEFKEWEQHHRPCFDGARLIKARWN